MNIYVDPKVLAKRASSRRYEAERREASNYRKEIMQNASPEQLLAHIRGEKDIFESMEANLSEGDSK